MSRIIGTGEWLEECVQGGQGGIAVGERYGVC